MRWIGRSIMAIAALHFVAAFFLYPTGLLEALGYSLAGSIPPFTVASEAYWFLFFAFPALMVGLLIVAVTSCLRANLVNAHGKPGSA